MEYHYTTSGTCSKAIDLVVEDGIVKSVKFTGGCHGNTQGVAALVTGRRVDEVIGLIKGIKCGARPTSCPDQLACALEAAMGQQ